ncbi:MAG: peptide-binding protein [Candidatus Wallbacteria bacterium]|nr:peptide-binding protein [Candidatus Wallbacteria bacterium]
MKKNLSPPFLLSIALFLLLLSGCTDTTPKREPPAAKAKLVSPSLPTVPVVAEQGRFGGTLIFGSIKEPVTLNPLLYTDNASGQIINLIFNGLLKYSPGGDLEKDLAESYMVNAGGMGALFQIKSGITWQDGAPLTADDIVFTYQEIMKGYYPHSSYYSLMERAEKTGPLKVVFRFKEKYAPMLHLFVLKILPQHLLAGQALLTSPFNYEPVGTGPFQLVSWEQGEMLHLTANSGYHSGRPYVDRFIYRIIPDSSILFFELMRGQIHFMPLRADQFFTSWGIEKMPASITKHSFDSHDFNLLGFNLTRPLFQNLKIRQALNYAIDRDKIIEGTLLGMGEKAVGPYHRNHWAFNRDLKPYPYSPEMAEKLLASEGYKRNQSGILEKDGLPFEFTIATNRGDHERELICLIIRDDLKKLGIRVNIKTFDWTDIIRNLIRTKNFDVLLIGFGPDPDPDSIYPLWHSSQCTEGFNFFSYSNPQVDELLDKGRKTMNQDERKLIYREFQKILYDDLPGLFLYHPKLLYGVNSSVRNLRPGPYDFSYEIDKWYFKTDGP